MTDTGDYSGDPDTGREHAFQLTGEKHAATVDAPAQIAIRTSRKNIRENYVKRAAKRLLRTKRKPYSHLSEEVLLFFNLLVFKASEYNEHHANLRSCRELYDTGSKEN